MADKEENSYDDIINQPHPISAVRSHVSMMQRASQFSPFIPQEGYDTAVRETARLTDARIELGEDLKELLNRKLHLLHRQEGCRPRVSVTYFQPDARKINDRLRSLTEVIQNVSQAPVLLVSPVHLGESEPGDPCADLYPARSVEVSRSLAALLQQTAEELGTAFLDAARFAEPAPADHVHLSPDGHRSLARAFANKIKQMEI